MNGHTGNQFLRQLAVARKPQFDAGTYTDKRAVSSEIVTIIKNLDPPGRFLCKAKPTRAKDGQITYLPPESEWVELDLERAIHKACQVMRDIDRQDRKERDERRIARKLRTKVTSEARTGCAIAKAEPTESGDVSSEEKVEEIDVNAADVGVEEAIASMEGLDESTEEFGTTESV